MTIIIKKTDSPAQIKRKLSRLASASRKTRKTKGFPAEKFAGKLKGVFGDGLEYQKKVRDKWA